MGKCLSGDSENCKVQENAEWPVTFSEKPNAFLILFGAILRKGPQKSP